MATHVPMSHVDFPGNDDAELLARQLGKFEGQVTPQNLSGLPKYTADARLLIDGKRVPWKKNKGLMEFLRTLSSARGCVELTRSRGMFTT